jgi:hypothetical protein
MKAFLFTGLLLIIISANNIGLAAINFGEEIYSAPFVSSSSNDSVEQTLREFRDSPENVTGVFKKIGNWFIRLDSWLKEKAGIDFFGILKAIGNLFVIVILWLADLIKILLAKV